MFVAYTVLSTRTMVLNKNDQYDAIHMVNDFFSLSIFLIDGNEITSRATRKLNWYANYPDIFT